MVYQRKADDAHIIRFNNVGLSLSGIAKRVGVHHTTVTYRLKALGLQPTDTRRAFMEDIFEQLTTAQQDWLIEQLAPGYTVKNFIRSLLLKEFITERSPENPGP